MCVTMAAKDEDIVSAACNLYMQVDPFNSFNWFRAFEADQWKDIYETASNKMASYVSAKQASRGIKMYGRNINFTLLAPSLWAVVEAIASNVEEDKYKRMLFKTGENSGFIIEVFDNISSAGKKIETMKALQGLGEQAMAKVSIQEGSVIKK